MLATSLKIHFMICQKLSCLDLIFIFSGNYYAGPILTTLFIYHFENISSNIDEVIRSVCFFYDKISQAQKSIKKNTRHNQYIKTLRVFFRIRFCQQTLWFFSR